MHEIRAELQRVSALVIRHVVVEFKIPIVAKREQRWIAHGRKLAAKGNLRITHIRGVRRNPFNTCQPSESVPGVGTLLASRDGQKSEACLIQEICVESVGPLRCAVDGMRAEVPAEPRQQALLQYARSKW